MRTTALLALGLQTAACAVFPFHAARAQELQRIPADTVGREVADTTRAVSQTHGPLPLALAAGFAMLLAAPSGLLFVQAQPDTTGASLDSWLNHVAVYATGGLTVRVREDGNDRYGWSRAGNLEVVQNGVYGLLQFEGLDVPDAVQYWTVRGGYLFHPIPRVAGGVTVGHRWARGTDVQNAFLLGLPFVFAGRNESAVRIEATYVVSTRGVTWNWLGQGEFRIPHTPLRTGMRIELKPPRQGGSYHFFVTALFGIGL